MSIEDIAAGVEEELVEEAAIDEDGAPEPEPSGEIPDDEANPEDEPLLGEDGFPEEPSPLPSPSPSPPEDELEDHLKESVEGSLRLKRLLTEDDPSAQLGAKKICRGQPPENPKIKQLQMRWNQAYPGMIQDLVVKHCLIQASNEELDTLLKSNWQIPWSDRKTPPELVAKQLAELRERKLPVGGALDTIASFRTRWKLDAASDKKLRKTSHKTLRIVYERFDGIQSLDDVIADAEQADAEDPETSAGSIPDKEGLFVMSRFSRLELIDPLADSAVFGDANLTFSKKLASHRKALGHVGRVIATTFEDLDTLRERYKEIDDTIKILEDHYAEVYHGVDCTRVALDTRFEGLEGSLGAVYYNFPHSGVVPGFFDGHPIVNWRHENLMRLFFRQLRSFMKPGGIVRVSSSSRAIGVRYSYIVGGAIENEFVHTETMPFLEWQLHRYGRSYGDKRDGYKRLDAANNQSYNAQKGENDMVYCFRYAPSGDTLAPQEIRLPPTMHVLMACYDGPFKMLQGEQKKKLAKQLHSRFVTEVSGTHVG